MAIFKPKESEFARVLRLYFKAERCSLEGDTIVNLHNDEIIGKMTCATYTGTDLIVQARLIVGVDDNDKDLYEDHVVVVNKGQIEEFLKSRRKKKKKNE